MSIVARPITARPLTALRIGEELSGGADDLVTNGSFDTDLSGWTVSFGSWVWDTGAAATTGTFSRLDQLIGERASAKTITIEYVKTSGRVQIQALDSTAANSPITLGNADLSVVGSSPVSVTMPSGYDTMRFLTTDATAVWRIENVSAFVV